VRLALRQAERKVPAALLKAECRMEELATMAAEGKAYLKAKQRAEIRQSVTDRLLPNMPPQLRAIPFVYLPGAAHLYVTALRPRRWTCSTPRWRRPGVRRGARDARGAGRDAEESGSAGRAGASFSPEMETRRWKPRRGASS
jgi:hypothetical protein